MIAAIIPAAGLSSRMGQNKLLLRFRGKSLVEHAVDTLMASAVDEIVVVLGYDAKQVQSRLEGKNLKFVYNANFQDGLSTSVRAGMAAVSDTSDAIMIYLADQPLLEVSDVNKLIGAFGEAKNAGKNIVVPFFDGQRGNPVIFAGSYREMILDIAGDTGCRRIIRKHPEAVFAVQMETDHVIRDVDTPEDLEKMREV